MRFLVDECTGPAVARWLQSIGHEVFSVYDQAPGMSDDDILQKAFDDHWIVITIDKDFGELVFRQNRPHRGIILMRLNDERTRQKIEVLEKLLQSYSDRLTNHFVVATHTQVRFGG